MACALSCTLLAVAGTEQARHGAAGSQLTAGSASRSRRGVGARLGRLQQVSSARCWVQLRIQHSWTAAATVAWSWLISWQCCGCPPVMKGVGGRS